VLSATIDLPRNRYPDDASRAQFYQRLLEAVRALPGVASAGLVNNLPFSGNDGSASYLIEGRDIHAGTTPHGYMQMVDEDFFRSLRIPVHEGRVFASQDAGGDGVAVIDELLAKKYFPGRSAIGQRLSIDYSLDKPEKTRWLTIVGVVGAVKRERLSETVNKETVYAFYKQYPEASATLALRASMAPEAMTAALRGVLQRLDPEQPLFDVRSMDERIRLSLDDRRTPMLLLILFAGVALALSAVGIYGVLAFAVALRTGEIGVRLSLGARRADILRLVLGDGGRLTAIGLALGLAGAVGLGFAVRSQLFGVSAVDAPSLLLVLALIAATAFVACWLPARRAAQVDPIVALRRE
jgi:predicted permease